jgi:hypothetical protein
VNAATGEATPAGTTKTAAAKSAVSTTTVSATSAVSAASTTANFNRQSVRNGFASASDAWVDRRERFGALTGGDRQQQQRQRAQQAKRMARMTYQRPIHHHAIPLFADDEQRNAAAGVVAVNASVWMRSI